VPAPYGGWAEQLASCSPSVAQALVPYPQYCGALQGLNENAGNSTYHSFQFKAEKRFADGVWFLGSYTLSKLLTNADSAQSSAQQWSGAAGAISPFERQRTKSLSVSDVPQTLSLALIYDLPVGKGKRLMNRGGVLDKVLGGWGFNTVFRINQARRFSFDPATATSLISFGWVAFLPVFQGLIRLLKAKAISIRAKVRFSAVLLLKALMISTCTMVKGLAYPTYAASASITRTSPSTSGPQLANTWVWSFGLNCSTLGIGISSTVPRGASVQRALIPISPVPPLVSGMET